MYDLYNLEYAMLYMHTSEVNRHVCSYRGVYSKPTKQVNGENEDKSFWWSLCGTQEFHMPKYVLFRRTELAALPFTVALKPS